MFELVEPAILTTASTEADMSGAPTDAVISTKPALGAIAAFFPETFSEADLTEFFEALDGTVTFTDGVITANLTSTDTAFTETFDAVAVTDALLDELTGITAVVGIDAGVATVDLTTAAGDTSTEVLDLNALTETVLLPLLGDIEGSFIVEEGIVDIDFDTDAGDITGELNLLGGELGVFLDTPFGPIDESIPFAEGDEFTVPLGESEVTFNLFNGTVTLNPDTTEAVELDLEDIPLTVSLDDGLATVEVTGLGPIGEPFDFDDALSNLILPIVAGTDGEFTLSDGILTGGFDIAVAEDGDLESPDDPTLPPETPPEPIPSSEEDISVFVDFNQLLTDASDFLTSLTGSLSISGGTVTSTLTSDSADLTGEVDLVEFADDIAAVASILDMLDLIDVDEPDSEEPADTPVVIIDDPVVIEDPVVIDTPVIDIP